MFFLVSNQRQQSNLSNSRAVPQLFNSLPGTARILRAEVAIKAAFDREDNDATSARILRAVPGTALRAADLFH